MFSPRARPACRADTARDSSVSMPTAARVARAASLSLSDAAARPISEVYDQLASSETGLSQAEATAPG